MTHRNGAEVWSKGNYGQRRGGESSRPGRVNEQAGPRENKNRFAVSAEGLINSKKSEVNYLSEHELKMFSAFLGNKAEWIDLDMAEIAGQKETKGNHHTESMIIGGDFFYGRD